MAHLLAHMDSANLEFTIVVEDSVSLRTAVVDPGALHNVPGFPEA